VLLIPLATLWWSLGTASAAELDLRVTATDYDLNADTERSVRRAAGRIYHLLRSDLGLALPERAVVNIRLIASRSRYDAEARAIGMTRPTLGYFSPRSGEGVVWKNESTEAFHGTFLHEMTHYLMALGGVGRAPTYLREGCAEAAESAKTDGNSVTLRPPARLVSWLQARVDALPPLGDLLGDADAWSGLPSTPVGGPEYGVGWSICTFMLSTDQGKRTLGNVLVSSATGSWAPAASAADETYPGGLQAMDRAWRSWIRAGPRPIPLPIPMEGGVGEGWRKCLDGSLVRIDSDQTCGRWVTGDDGWMRYVEDP